MHKINKDTVEIHVETLIDVLTKSAVQAEMRLDSAVITIQESGFNNQKDIEELSSAGRHFEEIAKTLSALVLVADDKVVLMKKP